MRTTKAFMASPIDLVNYHGKNHGLLTQIFHLIPYEWLGVSWCFWKFGIPQQSSTYYEIRCSTIFNPYEMLCLLVYNPLYTSFTTVSMAKNLSDWSYVHPTLLTPIGLPRHIPWKITILISILSHRNPNESHGFYHKFSHEFLWVLPRVLLDAWQPHRLGHLGEDATHQRLAMSIRGSTSVGRGMQQLLANKWCKHIKYISWGYRFHGFSWHSFMNFTKFWYPVVREGLGSTKCEAKELRIELPKHMIRVGKHE